ncbi:GNAT family N-acetyltransferase [Streptomyces sp. NPDC006645]|uniref:GNAT family N-acetyltransferase n=1 Tax=unclassified Streptomyces TaxID=2593676 RepID=UPI0033BB4A27
MSEERVSVRRRDPADLDACVRVLAEVHDSDGYPVDWPQDPAGWLAAAESPTWPGTEPPPVSPTWSGTEPPPVSPPAAWVALLDGQIVGHICLSPARPDDTAPGIWSARTGMSPAMTAVVSRLFVSPKARGHGIGALLLAETVRAAHERGLYPVLDVVTTDRSAAALYERQGWTLMATGEQHWGPDRTVQVHCYAAPR